MIEIKNDKLDKVITEYINIKVMIALVDKIYAKELITNTEYELLIKKYEKDLEDCYKKGEELWMKEK